jgi:NAD(P)-dependent dehydrogenase (short-subunit alcohol dehydrogenase family)
MAERIVGSERRLNALVNNAGIGTTLPGDGERMTTTEGHELRFAVNYLPRSCSAARCSRCSAPRRRPGSSTSPPPARPRSISTT